MFKGFSSGHRGFKLEYSKAACNWNFTAEQGRIMHSGIDDCLFTITAPDNYTISLYFNELTLYDSTECTHTSLRVSVPRIPRNQTLDSLLTRRIRAGIRRWLRWQAIGDDMLDGCAQSYFQYREQAVSTFRVRMAF